MDWTNFLGINDLPQEVENCAPTKTQSGHKPKQGSGPQNGDINTTNTTNSTNTTNTLNNRNNRLFKSPGEESMLLLPQQSPPLFSSPSPIIPHLQELPSSASSPTTLHKPNGINININKNKNKNKSKSKRVEKEIICEFNKSGEVVKEEHSKHWGDYILGESARSKQESKIQRIMEEKKDVFSIEKPKNMQDIVNSNSMQRRGIHDYTGILKNDLTKFHSYLRTVNYSVINNSWLSNFFDMPTNISTPHNPTTSIRKREAGGIRIGYPGNIENYDLLYMHEEGDDPVIDGLHLSKDNMLIPQPRAIGGPPQVSVIYLYGHIAECSRELFQHYP